MNAIADELAALWRMTTSELKQKYSGVFGEQARTANKDWLVKRISWRLQAVAEGDLSERARRRAAELADDADLRVTAPRTGQPKTDCARPINKKTSSPSSKDRLPMPGTVLARPYKGTTILVTVREEGFEYEGTLYRSLSGVAKAVTGSHWSGHLFFGLHKKGRARYEPSA